MTSGSQWSCFPSAGTMHDSASKCDPRPFSANAFARAVTVGLSSWILPSCSTTLVSPIDRWFVSEAISAMKRSWVQVSSSEWFVETHWTRSSTGWFDSGLDVVSALLGEPQALDRSVWWTGSHPLNRCRLFGDRSAFDFDFNFDRSNFDFDFDFDFDRSDSDCDCSVSGGQNRRSFGDSPDVDPSDGCSLARSFPSIPPPGAGSHISTRPYFLYLSTVRVVSERATALGPNQRLISPCLFVF